MNGGQQGLREGMYQGQRYCRDEFALTLQPHMPEPTLSWKRPETIFVKSMNYFLRELVATSDFTKAEFVAFFMKSMPDIEASCWARLLQQA